MNSMAYYNDVEFTNLWNKYHQDDTSLVCNNNILIYHGESKFIKGVCGVKKDECVNLGSFRIATMEEIFKLEPHIFFFIIREYLKYINFEDAQLFQYINELESEISKTNLTDLEEQTIISFTDYYNSLKSVDPYLRGKLLDVYNYLNKYIISIPKKMDPNNMPRGFQIILKRTFDQMQTGEEDSLNNNNDSQPEGIYNGKQRTRNSGFVPKPTPVPLSTDDYIQDDFTNAAFANVLLIIFLIIATIAVILTLLFT